MDNRHCSIPRSGNQTKRRKNGVSVLVVSCDKYADLWRPFFQIFWKRWADCPYPVYLGANHKTYSDDRVTTICVGDDETWTIGLRRMLERIPTSHVIIMLEDFFLVRNVNTAVVQEMVQLAKRQNLLCLRFRPDKAPPRRIRGLSGVSVDVGEIRRGDEYRISTQTAIWYIPALRPLLRPEFSAWDFEVIGSLMSDKMHGNIWNLYETAIDYRHGVERGKWLPVGLSICQNAGAKIDFDARPVMTIDEVERYRRSGQRARFRRFLVPRLLRRMLRLIWPRPDVRKLLKEAIAESKVQSGSQ